MVPTLFPNLKKFVPTKHTDKGDGRSILVLATLIQNFINNFTGRGPYEFMVNLYVGDGDKDDFIRLIRTMNVSVAIETNDVDDDQLKIVKEDLVIMLKFLPGY